MSNMNDQQKAMEDVKGELAKSIELRKEYYSAYVDEFEKGKRLRKGIILILECIEDGDYKKAEVTARNLLAEKA